MALQFPANPAGQTPANTYSPDSTPDASPNGVTYTWNGNYWKANISSEDIDLSGYVEKAGDTMTGNLTVPSLNEGPLAGFRNQFINGDFSINQRLFDTGSTSTTPIALCDRWFAARTSGTATATYRDTISTLPGFSHGIRKDTNEAIISQPVELTEPGTNSQFTVGSVWTCSFYASNVNPGRTVGQNFGNFRQALGNTDDQVGFGPITSVVTEEVVAGSWWRHSFTATVTGDASTSSATLVLLNVAPGGPNLPSTNITGCQLEPGPVATPFEYRHPAVEITMCERYYQRITLDGIVYNANSDVTTTRVCVPLRTSMRVASPHFESREGRSRVATSDGAYSNSVVTNYYAISSIGGCNSPLNVANVNINRGTNTGKKLITICGQNEETQFLLDAEF